MALVNAKAFFQFMEEREQVRLRKEAGLPQPWTDDQILREYKFTNVRRHHDWTSRMLRERFYTPHFDADRRSILMMAAFARYFGRFEFIDEIGWYDYGDWLNGGFNYVKEVAQEWIKADDKVFTGAYVITNQGISAPKQEVVVDHFLKDLHAATPVIMETVQMTRSWEQTAKVMRTIKGFGGTGFMTKEVLLDTTYTGFWDSNPSSWDDGFSFPKDWWSWTPIGPGARRGIARLLGFDDPKDAPNMKEHDLLYHIRKLQDNQNTRWYWNTEDHGELSPTDIQFQLCEFDKYERVRLGQGRPRSRYKPR